jgi:hypothetical protein
VLLGAALTTSEHGEGFCAGPGNGLEVNWSIHASPKACLAAS